MADSGKPSLEYAGWGFFGVLFVLFLGPWMYGAYRLKYSDTSAATWIGLGLSGAVVTAAVLTTIANSIIQARLEKKRAADRIAGKKKKRRG